MDRTSLRYLEHFHQMVLEGICCGLHHPIEWFISYGRAIGALYEDFSEINEFVDEASRELFEIEHVRSAKDNEEIQKWINDFYEHNNTKP